MFKHLKSLNKYSSKIICIGLFVITYLLFVASSASAASLSKPANNLGLIGYWSFDEGTTTTAGDFSGNGNNATLTNMSNPPTATSGWTSGKLGKALIFDGTDDYAISSQNLSITGAVARTLSFWARHDNTSDGTMISTGTAGSGTLFGPMVLSNKWYLNLFGATDWDTGVTADTRLHLHTITYDGTTIRWYIDGSLIGSQAKALTTGSGQMVAGMRIDSQFKWMGMIDDIRIYNRALTAAQVLALYNQGAEKLKTGVSNNGLVGYWSFNDATSTKATDFSGTGNTGTLTNMAIPPTSTSGWNNGRFGKGLNFDGTNDYVDVGNVSQINGSSQLTVSAWVKRNSNSTYGAIFEKYNGAGSWLTMMYHNSGFMYFVPSDIFAGYATLAQPLGTDWKYFTAVFDGTQTGNANRLKVYINGVQQSLSFTGTIPATIASSASVAKIGVDTHNSAYINGSIDEVRVLNRALSVNEVLALYNSGAQKVNSSQAVTGTTLDTGLVGMWSFDGRDLNGTTAYDRSGNNNNGTLTNTPTTTIGKVGQALSFNESNTYVTVPDNSSLQLTTTMTLSAWVYYTGNTGNIDTIFMKNNANTNYYGMYLSGNRAWFYNPTATAASGINTVPSNAWSHVTMTFDSTLPSNNIRIYVNGVFDNAVTKTSAIGSTVGTVLNIGRDPVNGRYFGGKIDEVRIYNRVLSADEVKRLYNMGK